MLIIYIGIMRSGKTLSSVVKCSDYRKRFPNRKIYSNIELELKNVVYTPYLILPLKDLKNCLILIDDISRYKKYLDSFQNILVNISGKNNITIIITCQYYTHVPLSLRVLTNEKYYCYYDKKFDILYNYLDTKDFIDFNNPFSENLDGQMLYCTNVVKDYAKIYDTKAIVQSLNDNIIFNEIRKICKNKTDIIENLHIFFKNKKTIEKYEKLI